MHLKVRVIDMVAKKVARNNVVVEEVPDQVALEFANALPSSIDFAQLSQESFDDGLEGYTSLDDCVGANTTSDPSAQVVSGDAFMAHHEDTFVSESSVLSFPTTSIMPMHQTGCIPLLWMRKLHMRLRGL